MADLLDLILGIGELAASWRFLVGLALTGVACLVIIALMPSQSAQWAVGVPTALAGLYLSLRWQVRADSGD